MEAVAAKLTGFKLLGCLLSGGYPVVESAELFDSFFQYAVGTLRFGRKEVEVAASFVVGQLLSSSARSATGAPSPLMTAANAALMSKTR
jgi:hypothetical protein